MFIGYFNLANTVTLLGLVSSIVAVLCASEESNGVGMYKLAIIMFLIAGLCDMFDGRIARGTGVRKRREKIFGIQLDSLADIVSFGVAPALIVYNMGYSGVADLMIYLVFIVCGAIRLAYFNTQALSDTPDMNMKHFTGVPIPFSCVALPFLVLLTAFIKNTEITRWIFRAFFLLGGLSFILKIRIKKIGLKTQLGIVVFEIICVLILLFVDELHLPL
ncbi:MAG: CDP-alcohol phosphatidyltransferase family protein [Eubacteriales bacterium]|nr:CDP-alcohol phosphatidyltransferase family protein [Eubacteriales bacterium]